MNTDELQLPKIINVRFSTRSLLENEAYRFSEVSIPKEALTNDREPNLRPKIVYIAKQIVQNPDYILLDNYEQVERAKDWVSLTKKQVLDSTSNDILPIDTRTRPGHKILDHHMRHFHDVKNYKGISVRNLITEEAVVKALYQNIIMHSTPYKSEIRRMFTMTGGLGNVTKYRTVTSKAIVQYFKATRVLDPCIGWGGRMLGTLSLPNTTYVGCDPDPNTSKGLRDIIADSAIPQSANLKGRATVLELPAEVALAQIASMPKFDLILTSPPYFNLEIYTAGTQSTMAYKTWDDWVEKWLKVVILGSLNCLTEGGTSCWSVKNFKSDKSYPLADATKKIHTDAGWVLVKTVTMTGSGRPGAARIEKGKEKRGSEEETFCFRRNTII
jgi:hypothetical protein